MLDRVKPKEARLSNRLENWLDRKIQAGAAQVAAAVHPAAQAGTASAPSSTRGRS